MTSWLKELLFLLGVMVATVPVAVGLSFAYVALLHAGLAWLGICAVMGGTAIWATLTTRVIIKVIGP